MCRTTTTKKSLLYSWVTKKLDWLCFPVIHRKTWKKGLGLFLETNVCFTSQRFQNFFTIPSNCVLHHILYMAFVLGEFFVSFIKLWCSGSKKINNFIISLHSAVLHYSGGKISPSQWYLAKYFKEFLEFKYKM